MAEKPHEVVESAPDPDEDDLDDLDDVLDEFSSSKPSLPSNKPTTASGPSASGPGRPTDTSSTTAAAKDNASIAQSPADDELAAQLQVGMSGLMAELDSNPDMQKQFEAMMQELIAAGAAPTDKEAGHHLAEAAKAAPGAPAAAPETSGRQTGGAASSGGGEFSDTIRKTMERMQQSGDAATAATSGAAADGGEEELLAQMMRELQGGGEGGEEDFNKMLLSMMSQLTNKEILYEPMKELHDKFPAWMAENAGTVDKADLDRYKEQQTLVGQIVGRFERSGYSDDNDADREYIVERMQKMQAAGAPPPDLVGDMNAAQEALGDLDAGCPTQ